MHQLSQHQRALLVDRIDAVQVQNDLGQAVKNAGLIQANNQGGHIGRSNVGSKGHDSQGSVDAAHKVEAVQDACCPGRRLVGSCHDYVCLLVPAGCEVARSAIHKDIPSQGANL